MSSFNEQQVSPVSARRGSAGASLRKATRVSIPRLSMQNIYSSNLSNDSLPDEIQRKSDEAADTISIRASSLSNLFPQAQTKLPEESPERVSSAETSMTEKNSATLSHRVSTDQSQANESLTSLERLKAKQKKGVTAVDRLRAKSIIRRQTMQKTEKNILAEYSVEPNILRKELPQERTAALDSGTGEILYQNQITDENTLKKSDSMVLPENLKNIVDSTAGNVQHENHEGSSATVLANIEATDSSDLVARKIRVTDRSSATLFETTTTKTDTKHGDPGIEHVEEEEGKHQDQATIVKRTGASALTNTFVEQCSVKNAARTTPYFDKSSEVVRAEELHAEPAVPIELEAPPAEADIVSTPRLDMEACISSTTSKDGTHVKGQTFDLNGSREGNNLPVHTNLEMVQPETQITDIGATPQSFNIRLTPVPYDISPSSPASSKPRHRISPATKSMLGYYRRSRQGPVKTGLQRISGIKVPQSGATPNLGEMNRIEYYEMHTKRLENALSEHSALLKKADAFIAHAHSTSSLGIAASKIHSEKISFQNTRRRWRTVKKLRDAERNLQRESLMKEEEKVRMAEEATTQNRMASRLQAQYRGLKARKDVDTKRMSVDAVLAFAENHLAIHFSNDSQSAKLTFLRLEQFAHRMAVKIQRRFRNRYQNLRPSIPEGYNPTLDQKGGTLNEVKETSNQNKMKPYGGIEETQERNEYFGDSTRENNKIRNANNIAEQAGKSDNVDKKDKEDMNDGANELEEPQFDIGQGEREEWNSSANSNEGSNEGGDGHHDELYQAIHNAASQLNLSEEEIMKVADDCEDENGHIDLHLLHSKFAVFQHEENDLHAGTNKDVGSEAEHQFKGITEEGSDSNSAALYKEIHGAMAQLGMTEDEVLELAVQYEDENGHINLDQLHAAICDLRAQREAVKVPT